jgi:hypothetical protein
MQAEKPGEPTVQLPENGRIQPNQFSKVGRKDGNLAGPSHFMLLADFRQY